MTRSTAPKTPRKRMDGEALTAILLLALTAFLILTVSILIFRSCSNQASPPISDATTPHTPITPPTQERTPIFSNGVLPSKPFFGERSATVSFPTTSQYIILTNASTGEVVASLNSGTRFSPASMTKVMTLIVMCERLTEEDLNKTVTFTSAMYDYVRTGDYADSTNYGIEPNDEYKIKDLLYGIGMYSASDCD